MSVYYTIKNPVEHENYIPISFIVVLLFPFRHILSRVMKMENQPNRTVASAEMQSRSKPDQALIVASLSLCFNYLAGEQRPK